MTTDDHELSQSGLRAEPAPPPATELFGKRLPLAVRYAELLAGEGVEHGLIGPREVPRLWDRHLLNSAVVTDLVPVGARIVDVGTGAGLPGIPMALRRPDLRVDLVEPMLRRITFLSATVDQLGLTESVRVIRGRADDPHVRSEAGAADWVVARAVAPLDRLVRWCLPLLAGGGRLLALKGSTAQDEVAEYRSTLGKLGAGNLEVIEVNRPGLTPTWVVSIECAPRTARQTRRGRR